MHPASGVTSILQVKPMMGRWAPGGIPPMEQAPGSGWSYISKSRLNLIVLYCASLMIGLRNTEYNTWIMAPGVMYTLAGL
jgi:hypothetical protein